MRNARQAAVAALAAIVLLFGAAVKGTRNAVVDIFRSDHHVPTYHPPPPLPPPSHFQYEKVATGVLCSEFGRIARGDRPVLSADDLLASVAKETVATLSGANPFVAEDVVDSLGTVRSLSGTVNPQVARYYLRYCPPL